MATTQFEATKKVSTSQIKEDLVSGLTWWKKDDIGFGSLEKKYNLTMSEMVSALNHPKLKNLETRIPTFVIVDDLPDEEEITEEVIQTRIEVARPTAQRIEVQYERVEEQTEIKAFI